MDSLPTVSVVPVTRSTKHCAVSPLRHPSTRLASHTRNATRASDCLSTSGMRCPRHESDCLIRRPSDLNCTSDSCGARWWQVVQRNWSTFIACPPSLGQSVGAMGTVNSCERTTPDLHALVDKCIDQCACGSCSCRSRSYCPFDIGSWGLLADICLRDQTTGLRSPCRLQTFCLPHFLGAQRGHSATIRPHSQPRNPPHIRGCLLGGSGP